MLQFIYSKSSLSLIEMMAFAISVTQGMFLSPLKRSRAALTPTMLDFLLLYSSVSSWAYRNTTVVLQLLLQYR